MDLFVVLPSLLVVIALIAIFSGRSEPDPDQERPQAIYLSLVALVTLAVVLGSVFAVLGGLVGLTDKHSGSGYWSSYSSGCAYSFGSDDDSDTPPRLEEGDDCEYHEDRGKANHDDDVRARVARSRRHRRPPAPPPASVTDVVMIGRRRRRAGVSVRPGRGRRHSPRARGARARCSSHGSPCPPRRAPRKSAVVAIATRTRPANTSRCC